MDNKKKEHRSISGHQTTIGKNDEWFTPPHIIAEIGLLDLDPCTSANRPWPTAKNHFTPEDDGLAKKMVWVRLC